MHGLATLSSALKDYPMPLQNRVTPLGEIIADPGRGRFTGNRGCLCDQAGQLAQRRWRLKAWIICQLSYKGWWRPVMQPGVWTELFFLDEATALAAGHRPCALCRRAAYKAYRAAWTKAQGLSEPPKAVAMDARLHEERICRDRSKVTFAAEASQLPDGTMVSLEETPRTARLILKGRLLTWSPAGYVGVDALPRGQVTVLTPRSSVAVLKAGYRPFVHPGAARLAG